MVFAEIVCSRIIIIPPTTTDSVYSAKCVSRRSCKNVRIFNPNTIHGVGNVLGPLKWECRILITRLIVMIIEYSIPHAALFIQNALTIHFFKYLMHDSIRFCIWTLPGIVASTVAREDNYFPCFLCLYVEKWPVIPKLFSHHRRWLISYYILR